MLKDESKSLFQETFTGTSKPKFRDVFQGKVNTKAQDIYSNIRTNIRRPLPQVQAYPPNEYKVALVCGGPSINEELPTIKRLAKRGYKIATVNNTYNWVLEHGMTPSAHAQLDAREHNARFVSQPVESCRYMLMSQVHPKVFDRLQGHDVHVWHGTSSEEKKILNRYYMKRWINIPGGSSIGTRALYLLYFLGMRTIRVFGMDSSMSGKAHHAYEQSENDADLVLTVRVGRRKFKAASWMVAQLDEFIQLAPRMPDDLKVSFEGDGMLQYMVKQTALRGRFPRVTLVE